MRLVVVRHGETKQNAKGVSQGQMPGELSALGKQQAKRLGQKLAQEEFDIIYCSDLKRTKDTLFELHKHHKDIPVIYSKALRERHMGSFQGKIRTAKDWSSLPGSYLNSKPPGGESVNEMKIRIGKFLEYLKANHPNEKILIITHGGVMRVLEGILSRSSLINLFKNFKFANTSINEYEIIGKKVKKIRFNDSAHN